MEPPVITASMRALHSGVLVIIGVAAVRNPTLCDGGCLAKPADERKPPERGREGADQPGQAANDFPMLGQGNTSQCLRKFVGLRKC